MDQAEAAFIRARDLTHGKVAEIHRQLAALYIDLKRYREAADELEVALKADPKSADADKLKELVKELRDKAAAAKL
jgi:Tfp pilus assembly protein PilF